MVRPKVLYHASRLTDIEEFVPRRGHYRDANEGPVIFAAPSKAVASIFLVESDDSWVASGLHNDIPYIAVAHEKRYCKADKGGAIYTLPGETFLSDPHKGLGENEWVSKVPVKPLAKEVYESGIEAMLNLGVQVYFIDKKLFKQLSKLKYHGMLELMKTESENQKRGLNSRSFV